MNKTRKIKGMILSIIVLTLLVNLLLNNNINKDTIINSLMSMNCGLFILILIDLMTDIFE